MAEMLAVAAVAMLVVSQPSRVPPQPFSGRHLSSFRLSPDGKRLAMACVDVWDVERGTVVTKFKTLGWHEMAFTRDNKLLAAGGNYARLGVFDAETGKVYRDLSSRGHGAVISNVAFTPDGRYLVSSSEGILRVWDIRKRLPVVLVCISSTDERVQSLIDDFLHPLISAAGGVSRQRSLLRHPPG